MTDPRFQPNVDAEPGQAADRGSAPTQVAARRGDLVLVEYRHDAMSGMKGSDFAIERVTGVTRDGWARVTATHLFGQDRDEPLFRVRTSRGRPYRDFRCYYVTHYVIPAGRVDVIGLWLAWCARHEDWRVPPFESLDQAQAFVAPYLRTEAHADGDAGSGR